MAAWLFSPMKPSSNLPLRGGVGAQDWNRGTASLTPISVALALLVFGVVVSYLLIQVSVVAAMVAVLGAAVFLACFISIQFSVVLLILSTLLSPELQMGGGGVGTTASRGVTIRVDDLLLALIAFAWLARMAVRKDLGFLRSTVLNGPMKGYLAVVALGTTMAFVEGRLSSPLVALMYALKYLEFFLIYFAVINTVEGPKDVRRFLAIMFVTCAVVSILGIMQIPSGGRVSAPFEGEEGEPNTFSGYLVLLMGLMAGVYWHKGVTGKNRLILFVFLMLTLPPFLYTESRAGYLAAAMAYVAFWFYAENKRQIAMATLAILAVSPFVVPDRVIDRISYTFNQSEREAIGYQRVEVAGVTVDTSTTERLESWKNVLTRDYFKHPVIGFGATGYRFVDAQYVRVLAESGAMGFLFFSVLLVRIFKQAKALYRETDDPLLKGVAHGLMAALIGLLAHAVGSNTFAIVRVMEPFMIATALVVASLQMLKQQRGETALAETASGQAIVEPESMATPIAASGRKVGPVPRRQVRLPSPHPPWRRGG